MKTDLPPNGRDKIYQIADIIRDNRTFLITTHQHADGDAIGSQIAVYSMLRRMGKEAVMVNHDKVPAIYEFLPFVRDIRRFSPDISASFDVTIFLDCGSAERAGDVSTLASKSRHIINIDHHSDNREYGSLNWVGFDCSSTGEMVYQLLEELGEITRDEASCLYAAIITDTGNFVYNMGSDTMRVVMEIFDKGIDAESIARKVIFDRPLKWMKLLALCLSKMKYDKDAGICWTYLDGEMFRDAGAGEEDSEGFVEFLSRIKEARVVFLLRESGERRIKASLRSRSGYNVQRIAGIFGGGGHKMAAGCYIEDASLEEAAERIISSIIKEEVCDEKNN